MLLLALACAQHGEVALRSLDGLLRRGEALAREQRGEHTAPRRVPRVERLGHGAEVFLEPRGLGGGEREGRARLAGVEAEEAPRGGGRAHGAEGARGVEPLLVVRRVHHRRHGRLVHAFLLGFEVETTMAAGVSSPAARAAASTGAEGWPIMAKLVSSKSSACAAVPLARAAHTAPVRSGVPTTVARGEPPSARATSVTRRAAGSTEPASITPRQSRMARRAASTASAGQSSQRLFVTNSARCEVARMAESLAQVCYHLPMALARSVLSLAALSFFVLPVPASAQIFIASVADPSFAVGPLTIRATVTPSLGPVDVEVRWSLDVDTGKSRGLEQDIFLLWPGEVTSPLGDGKGDKTLEKYVEARGFSVVGSGRLQLYVQNIYGEGVESAPKP